jgi:mono/diheme cytochrome c family protein
MACSLSSLIRSTGCLLLLGTLASSFAQAAAPDGKAVYDKWCAPCHSAGPGNPGTESLQMKYGDKVPAVLLDRTDLSADVVATFVRQGVLLMAPFRKTEITDSELDALSRYVARNYKKAP